MSTNTRVAGEAKGDEKHEAHKGDNPAPEAGMSRDQINIGLNVFQVSTAHLDEETREMLAWLWGYAFDELKGSKAALCAALGYEWQTVHRAFSGGMEGGELASFLAVVAALRRRQVNSVKLVPTLVTKRVREALEYCRETHSMVSVRGPTGRGKTLTAMHWTRDNNHGKAIYVRAPSSCQRRALVTQIAQRVGIGSVGKKTVEVEGRLYRAFSSRNTLIVDEAGHLIPRYGTGAGALELLRDLHDMCECGVALIFTDVYLDEIRHGKMAAYFEQFLGRIKFEVTIPTRVLRVEVEDVVRSVAPGASDGMVGYALGVANGRDGKLRTLFEDLGRSAEWARSKGRKEPGLEDLKMAVEWRKSGGIWPEE